MKATTILTVLVAARWLGTASLAGVWQVVVVAAMFALGEALLVRVRAGRWAVFALYWAIVGCATINIPVVRALSTPITWPMLRAARGPLLDSFLEYASWTNALRMSATLALAATLPDITADRARPRNRRMILAGLACAAFFVVPDVMRAVTASQQNPIVALIVSLRPHVDARPIQAEWRDSPFAAGESAQGRQSSSAKLHGAGRGRNVVFVSLESTAAQYLRLYGGPAVTPRLDDLSRDALVFDNAYAAYPESIKGLFSVLCSTFPAFDISVEVHATVPCRSLASELKDAGYRTAMFHSGRFGYLGMDAVIRNRGYDVLADAGDIGGVRRSSFGVDDATTVDRALAWIDDAPGSRFFLTYLPTAGHHPYAAPERGPVGGAEQSDRHRYLNALWYGDKVLGALIDGLRARGLERDTLWVIAGDHGEAFGQHPGNFGHTFAIYDENVHVPLIIALPGAMSGQRRDSGIVSLVDIGPTILDLLGLPAPAGDQGHSALEPSAGMALFFTDYATGLAGLRDGPWKYVLDIDSHRGELFDMAADPLERTDRTRTQPVRARWYRQHLIDWAAAQKARITNAARTDPKKAS
jgi:hypothetical protein